MVNNMEPIKTEIADWLKSLEDETVLLEILKIKNRLEIPRVSEERTAYSIKDDFDERFAQGLTMEESRKRTREFIEKLPWKKQ
ncbi:hypothetical protein FIC_01606 [Flavobacteriaceae bacterium 3519-10]|nr:hypothetical protein FIC_01606 [Flavobacteriaceae bacterium 3519-10]